MPAFHLIPSSLSCPLPLLFLLLYLLPHPILCQINNANGQYGSFFTAIYLNGSPLPASSVSCNNMGGGGYCCSSSSSCGWDANQNVACCASGASCSGSAQQQGSPQQYAQPAACETCGCDTCHQYQQQTTTVIQTPAAVAPAVVQQTYPPQQQQYTTVAPPETTTVQGVAEGGVTVKTEVPVGQACGAGGYTTLVYQNVGEPARTVGCYVIYNAGAGKVMGEGIMSGGWGWGVWVVGMVVWGGWIGLR